MDAQILTFASGILVPLITKWLREAKWFTLVENDQSGRVKALAAVLAALSALLVSWKDGDLSQASIGNVTTTLFGFISTLGISAFVHHWFLKKTETKT